MEKPNLKRNFIYSILFQIFSVAMPLVTAPYLARVLGPDGAGIQSFTASVQSYFVLLAALGTTSYGAREISRHRDSREEYSKLFWEIEGITVFTTLLSTAAWVVMIVFAGEYRLFYIAMIPNLIAVIFDISWFYSGLEDFRRTVVRNMFFKTLGIVLMFLLVKSKEDLWIYILIRSLSVLAANSSLWLDLPRFLQRVELRELRFGAHLRQSMVYFIPTIATSVYTMLDKTLIGVITNSKEQNGYYEQAENVLEVAKRVSFAAINSVLGVRIAYLFKEHKEDEIRHRIAESMNFILFMAIGCACGIVGIAVNFVPIFFGDGYEPVTPLLYILSPIVVIIGISTCLGAQYYTPSGKRAESTKYLIMGAVINLMLNLCLIPGWGAAGAALASIIAEFVITGLYVHFSRGYMTVEKLVLMSWKKLAAGLLMTAGVWFLGRLDLGYPIAVLAIQICMGVLIYCLALWVLRDSWFCSQVKTFFKVL